MQNFFHKQQNPKEAFSELRVKEYLSKYIKELQRHSDVSDKKMRVIIYKIYKDLSPFSFIKNWIYMVKSKYSPKIRIKRK